MTTRIQDNMIKAILFIILFTILLCQSLLVNAQVFQRQDEGSYKGFVASFGVRSAELSSNIGTLHQSSLHQTGGKVGVLFGNEVVRANAGLIGYYSSTGRYAGTTDLYVSDIALNFYPLSWISGKSLVVEPYIAGGLSYDRYKFYGYYLNQEPGQTNYSQTEAPYLGKIKQINATAGVGVEVKLKARFDFIHLFSELTYGHNLSAATANSAFARTSISNQTHLVVGISFGSHR